MMTSRVVFYNQVCERELRNSEDLVEDKWMSVKSALYESVLSVPGTSRTPSTTFSLLPSGIPGLSYIALIATVINKMMKLEHSTTITHPHGSTVLSYLQAKIRYPILYIGVGSKITLGGGGTLTGYKIVILTRRHVLYMIKLIFIMAENIWEYYSPPTLRFGLCLCYNYNTLLSVYKISEV